MGFFFYKDYTNIIMDKKFDLRDISIIPAIESGIDSRKYCQTRKDFNGAFYTLPLLAAPMDTVVCSKNRMAYVRAGIVPCIPRGQYCSDLGTLDKEYMFQSFGLQEIEEELEMDLVIEGTNHFFDYPNILIDIANGHMTRLLKIVAQIKIKYPKIKIMVGNVAHPLTYKNLALAGADYVRCSIGTGAGCTTAANVAINYPLGSLISECHKIKKDSNLNAKIVADGGMQGFDDIIKALALGADYVMVGSLFNKSMQSAGFNYLYGVKIPFHIAKTLWKWGFPVKKKYRGMSTKAVQRKWGKTRLVTAEGITKYQKVEYNLHQWTENFEDYLRSNMSYCGARNLYEFIGEAEWVFITDAARQRFAK
jgi:IMP dehydrogenase/GMP reductase